MSSSDRDFPYKLTAKRFAWVLGYLPLINVPVGLPPALARRGKSQLTDLDVLGLKFSADGDITRLVADCRSTPEKAPDRLFWLRGLGDFAGADQLYLLKQSIPQHARWLAEKMNIRVIDERDQLILGKRLNAQVLRGPYFDKSGYEAIGRIQQSFSRGSAYHAVSMFLREEFWGLFPAASRVQSLLDLLRDRETNKTFNPEQHEHQSLVLHATLQLAIATAETIAKIGLSDLPDLEARLREALHGGEAAFREKLQLAQKLNRAGRTVGNDLLDLPSFPGLLEVVNRFIARRYLLNDTIRFLDVAWHYHAVRQQVVASRLFRDPIAVKLAADVLDLFVTANGLDRRFRELSSPWLPPAAASALVHAETGQTERSKVEPEELELHHQVALPMPFELPSDKSK